MKTDINSEMKGVQSVETDIENLNQLANVTYGQERYVIRSLVSLVSSLYRLENTVDKSSSKTVTSINTLTKTIKELDAKNSKLQATGIFLSGVATVFTILSFIQVVEILRQWFKWW